MIPITAVIKSPIVTEKSVAMKGKYSFVVDSRATKIEVAQAVKEFYKVDVDKVNVSYIRSKQKVAGRGRTTLKRTEKKRAIVTLKPGVSLDFNAFK